MAFKFKLPKFTLIEDAKNWWRMASMRIAALWAAVQVAWPLLPDDQKAAILGSFIPTQYAPAVIAGVGFLLFVSARLVKQESVSGPAAKGDSPSV